MDKHELDKEFIHIARISILKDVKTRITACAVLLDALGKEKYIPRLACLYDEYKTNIDEIFKIRLDLGNYLSENEKDRIMGGYVSLSCIANEIFQR